MLNIGTVVSFEYDYHANNIDKVIGIVIESGYEFLTVRSIDPPTGVLCIDCVAKESVTILSDADAMLWKLENL